MKGEEKKYEFTGETLKHFGHTLHRIRALRNFGAIKKGDLGGYIENKKNLTHEGNCWVYEDAWVYGKAQVFGHAKVCEDARVYGNARVFGSARVCGKARVFGRAQVADQAWVGHHALVYGDASVSGNAYVNNEALIYGYARVYGEAWICGKVSICNTDDYIVFKNWWSSGRYFTWTRSNNMWVAGCFYGTGKQLVAKAYRDSKKSGREYERVVKYVESILADEQTDEQKGN